MAIPIVQSRFIAIVVCCNRASAIYSFHVAVLGYELLRYYEPQEGQEPFPSNPIECQPNNELNIQMW